jgi:hypothetical protein
MKAIGLPVLIYLLGLPLLAIISRGRGQIALMLFIAWSIAMTAMTMYRRNLPVPDRARISEADLLWCEALPPSETDSRNAGETRLSSVFSYSAETPAPRSIAFQAADAMLDEIVNPNTWPYGSVTIGEGSEARLPDLPLEPVMVGTEKIVSRTFTCRRTMPELTATGLLTVTPSSAHLTLDATLPFSATAGLMFVQSKVMTVRKDLGRTDGSMHFDTDLVEGTEINRQEGLLKKQNDYNRENRPWVPPSPPDEGIEGVLRSFWGTVSSIAVSRGQQYTMSRVTGRPGRAYVLIASKAIPTRITVDRGTLEQNAITVAVISLPIVYEDFPD